MRKRSAWLVAVAAAVVLALPSPDAVRAQESGEEAAAPDPGEVGGLLGVFFPGTGSDDEEDSAEAVGPAESEDAASVAEEPEAPRDADSLRETAAEEPDSPDVADPAGDRATEELLPAGEEAPPADTVTGEPAAPERTGPAGSVAADEPGTPEGPEPPPGPAAEEPAHGEPPVPVLGEERDERDDAAPPVDLGREEPPAWPAEAPPAPVTDPEKPPAVVARPEPVPVPTPDLDADLRASRRPREEAPVDPDSIRLPTEEIHGEIEKPDIFFLLPKARSRSDEQLIRSRIRREITRPLIKDWLEEELLLK